MDWKNKYLLYDLSKNLNSKGISLEQVFYKKYLLYKSKYLALKKMSGGFVPSQIPIKEEIVYDGDDIVQKISTKDNLRLGESSRFNIKTKEVKHWYATLMCNNIISNLEDKSKRIKILVLGVALGGILVHLLDKLPNAEVTGVDITSQHYHIVRKYTDSNRLKLIEADANEFIKNSEPKFDIIISDIFDNITVPDFVLSKEFLNNIKNKLSPQGKFLINTSGIEINKLRELFNNIFANSSIASIDVIERLSLTNTVSIIQLK
jgi:spermidine synthase